jgi:DUF1009 family protein
MENSNSYIKPTIVLLCGYGSLPFEFKEIVENQGYKVITVGVEGITKNKTDYQIPFLGFLEWESLLKELSKNYSSLRIAMLGKFEHSLIFNIFSNWTLFLSKKNLKQILALSLHSLFGKFPKFLKREYENFLIFEELKNKAKSFKAEEVIRTFIEYYENKGFKFLTSKEIKKLAKPLLLEKGFLFIPNHNKFLEKELIETAKKFFPVAQTIAEHDIGQTLIIKNGTVIAVEGIEGTNQVIKRAYQYTKGGFIMMKTARKNQDFRIDVPTVGLQTLKLLKRTKAKGLILEGEKIFISNKKEFLQKAKEWNIAIYSY